MVLRLWGAEDVAAMAAAVSESLEHLRPWMPWAVEEPRTTESRRKLVADFERAWDAGGDAVYGAFHDGVVVGGCGLHRRGGPSVLEIGYWVHVDHTGEGLATEMAAALTEAAFGTEGIERVEIHHDRANRASRAVAERLGFTFVGERPDAVAAPGEEGVDCTWAMTRDEWVGDSAALAAAASRGARPGATRRSTTPSPSPGRSPGRRSRRP